MEIVQALRTLAKTQPEAIALKVPHRSANGTLSYETISFSELDQRVDLLATHLLMRRFAKRKRVLLLVPPGEDLLMAVFALLRLGSIPVIIDPGMGLKNFFHCVKKTHPDCFLGCPKARWIFFLLKPWIHFSSAVFLSKRLKNCLRKHNFITTLQDDPHPNNTAAILFTSGSTGHPKGAVYTYAAFNAQLETLMRLFNIQPNEVDLPLLAVFSLYNPAMGLTTVVPEMDPSQPSALDPKKIVEAIRMNHVTHSFGSPRLWMKLADYCEQQHVQFPSVKRLFLAGAPVPSSLLKRVQALVSNGDVFTPYGATEALPIAVASARDIEGETEQRTLQGQGTCVGRIVPGVQVRIIPIDDGPLNHLPDALPQGEIGEIAVSAPFISSTYFNDEPATQYAKIRDPNGTLWHRMGDCGYQDAKGRLWFCGRKAERVVAHQQTFYTDPCEAIFNAHPDVFRSALIAFKFNGQTVPAMVIEPKQSLSKRAQLRLLQTLHRLAQNCQTTHRMHHFCCHKNFPVDVRHNAKIHRLQLARYFAKHPKRMVFFDDSYQ